MRTPLSLIFLVAMMGCDQEPPAQPPPPVVSNTEQAPPISSSKRGLALGVYERLESPDRVMLTLREDGDVKQIDIVWSDASRGAVHGAKLIPAGGALFARAGEDCAFALEADGSNTQVRVDQRGSCVGAGFAPHAVATGLFRYYTRLPNTGSQ